MAVETDVRETFAFATREENPTLLRNWEFPVAFAMSQVGVPELTEATLPLFMARQAVWYASFGERSPFGTDPTIPECFIGMTVWGRHSNGKMTDAQFGRHIVGVLKNNVGDLTRRYRERVPGAVMWNKALEDKAAGLCETCPSHHTPNLVHDGQRKDN
jgi:hypothetical protein